MPKVKIGAGRYQQQHDSRDDAGKRGNGGLNWNALSAQPKFFKPNVEILNKFNVIPFQIKSGNHPEVFAGRMEVGDYDFVLDYWVHRKIGADGVDVVCLKNTYGKKCPICEERGRLYDADQEDAAKDLKPTRRVVFNVQPITREGSGDLQVFDVSHFLFMKELMEEANACADGKGVIPFADLEDGKIVAFRATEEKGKGGTMTKFKSFKFLDRERAVREQVVESAISFDSLLVVHSYQEIEDILFANPTAEGAGKPATTNKARNDEEESDEELARQVFAKERAAEQNAKAGADTTAPAPDKPAETHEAKADAPAGNTCPHGHRWGTADEHLHCGRCPVWDACNKASV